MAGDLLDRPEEGEFIYVLATFHKYLDGPQQD